MYICQIGMKEMSKVDLQEYVQRHRIIKMLRYVGMADDDDACI